MPLFGILHIPPCVGNVPGMLPWSHEALQPAIGGEKGGLLVGFLLLFFFFFLRQKEKKSAKPGFDLTGKCKLGSALVVLA